MTTGSHERWRRMFSLARMIRRSVVSGCWCCCLHRVCHYGLVLRRNKWEWRGKRRRRKFQRVGGVNRETRKETEEQEEEDLARNEQEIRNRIPSERYSVKHANVANSSYSRVRTKLSGTGCVKRTKRRARAREREGEKEGKEWWQNAKLPNDIRLKATRRRRRQRQRRRMKKGERVRCWSSENVHHSYLLDSFDPSRRIGFLIALLTRSMILVYFFFLIDQSFLHTHSLLRSHSFINSTAYVRCEFGSRRKVRHKRMP